MITVSPGRRPGVRPGRGRARDAAGRASGAAVRLRLDLPFPSSSSSRAPCCGLSRSCDTGPLDRSASAPPSRQARRHRRTEPSVNPQVMPDLADPVAAGEPSGSLSHSRSRRCCPAAIYPPHSAYRMPWSYSGKRPPSRPDLYELILVYPRPSDPSNCRMKNVHCLGGPLRLRGRTQRRRSSSPSPC